MANFNTLNIPLCPNVSMMNTQWLKYYIDTSFILLLHY